MGICLLVAAVVGAGVAAFFLTGGEKKKSKKSGAKRALKVEKSPVDPVQTVEPAVAAPFVPVTTAAPVYTHGSFIAAPHSAIPVQGTTAVPYVTAGSQVYAVPHTTAVPVQHVAAPVSTVSQPVAYYTPQ